MDEEDDRQEVIFGAALSESSERHLKCFHFDFT